MKEYHFICKVEDTINKNSLIQQVYCDVTTTLKAEKFFKRHPKIKPYIGNKRYLIYFQQNPVLIQDKE